MESSTCAKQQQNGNGQDKKPNLFTYDTLVVDLDHRRVLVEVLAEKRVRMPRIIMETFSRGAYGYDTVEEMLGLQTGVYGYLIRYMRGTSTKKCETSQFSRTYQKLVLVESEEARRKPRPPWQWMGESELAKYDWGTEETNYEFDAGSSLAEVFQEAAVGSGNDEQDPWERLGWYGAMMSWTRRELEAKGISIVSRIRQRAAHSDRAFFMQCDIVRGRHEKSVKRKKVSEKLFMKCTDPRFKEAERTGVVARVIGDVSVEVLGANKELGVLLLGDVGVISDDALDEEVLHGAIGKMHKRCANRVDELLKEGVSVRDGHWLEKNIERIVNHPAFETYRKEWEVDEFMEYLRSKVEFIQGAGRKLAQIQGPLTLVHGDLGRHNLGRRWTEEGELYRFFDWEFCFVGNPLHDYEISTWRRNGEDMLDVQQRVFKTIDDAYLREFEKRLNRDDQVSLWYLVPIVCDASCLNQMLEYSDHSPREWSLTMDSPVCLYIESLHDSVLNLEECEHYKECVKKDASKEKI